MREFDEITRLLDNFEAKTGLPKLGDGLGECEILSTDIDEIRGWSNIDLAEAGLELAQYSFKLQRIINKQNAIKNWAQRLLDLYLADKIDGYGQYNEKKNKATLNDEYAEALYSLITKTGAVVERLSYLPARIQNIEKALEGLRYAKKE